jgi:hypothetical protein
VDTPQYTDPMILAAAAILLALLALIMMLIISMRQRNLLKRYRLLLSGDTGKNLEQVLLDQDAAIQRQAQEITVLQQQVATLTENGKLHIQRIATVRFNAFPDTGGDLSFAIALLDAYNNGFVISSLYGRNESRVYAKPIASGKSTYQLSDEERDALNRAMAQVV